MPKATFDRDTAFPLYCNAISEIRFRLQMVDTLLGPTPKMPANYTHEFCYLQLRKICELIAFGCLVAHGDIQQTNKLKKSWSAEKIISVLGRLHAKFYPEPFKIIRIFAPNQMQVGQMDQPFLTKAELLKLYNVDCPKFLHWGTIDDFVARRRPEVDQNKLTNYLIKIRNLLSHHRIHIFGTNQALQIDASLPNCNVNATLWASYPLQKT